jgi:hypothetical protein
MKTFAIAAWSRGLFGLGGLAILLACAATQAAATTITFESLAQAGTSSRDIPGPYIESGYQFVNNVSTFDFGTWQTGNANYPGSTALFNNRQAGVTTLTQVGGGDFSMVSLDLMAFATNSASQTVTFTGTLANNSTVTQSFTVPASGSSITETLFVFTTPGFTDVKSVAFGPQNLPDYQFDNVTVQAVPEASSNRLLFGVALILGLNFLRGRSASRRATA